MKNLKVASIIMLLFFITSGCEKTTTVTSEEPAGKELEGTITISGAWALYPMAIKWGEEFQKIHPRVRIDISAGGAGKGMADALAKVVDIGMVSRAIYPQEIEKGAWWISVTKDAVVPTINENNPILEDLLAVGVKKEILIGIWIDDRIKNWNHILGKKNHLPIHLYTRSDACGAAATWAEFLDEYQEDLQGIGVYGDPGLAKAISEDVLGIGYNNINYAYDQNSKMQVKGIRVLPIDLNGNGKIDEEENFYANRDQIVDAIARGKYPSPPARYLHFVFKGKPTKKCVVTFLKWVLTEAQQYIPEVGYINLSEEKLREELKKIQE